MLKIVFCFEFANIYKIEGREHKEDMKCRKYSEIFVFVNKSEEKYLFGTLLAKPTASSIVQSVSQIWAS